MNGGALFIVFHGLSASHCGYDMSHRGHDVSRYASIKSQISSFLGRQVGSHRGYDGSHRGHNGASVFIHFLLSFWLIFDLVFIYVVA
jgi:hypothetical protein